MMRSHGIGSVFAFCLAAAVAGCGGDSPDNLATVTGEVKLDGQPLEGALVEFIPQTGSTSMGRTDAAGKYELQFNRDYKGAVIGQHQVKISTYNTGDPEADPPRQAVPEKIPAKYNVKTELTKIVEDEDNTIDFDLDSKGEIISPEQLSRAGDY